MSDPVPAPHPLAVMLADREKEVRAARPEPEEEEDTPMPDPGYKECTRCNAVKPRAAFNKWSRSRDGLQSWCRECQKASSKTKPKPPNKGKASKAQEAKPSVEPAEIMPEEIPTTSTENPDATPITWVFTGATVSFDTPFDPTLSQLRRLQTALRDDLDPGLDYDLDSVVAVATVVLDALKDSDA